MNTVSLGNSNTEVRMVVDTASFLSWVPTTACTSCGEHARVPLDSSVQISLWEVTFGCGTVTGSMSETNMTLFESDISLPNFQLGQASDVQIPWYPTTVFDGVLALGFSHSTNPKFFVTTLRRGRNRITHIYTLDPA